MEIWRRTNGYRTNHKSHLCPTWHLSSHPYGEHRQRTLLPRNHQNDFRRIRSRSQFHCHHRLPRRAYAIHQHLTWAKHRQLSVEFWRQPDRLRTNHKPHLCPIRHLPSDTHRIVRQWNLHRLHHTSCHRELQTNGKLQGHQRLSRRTHTIHQHCRRRSYQQLPMELWRRSNGNGASCQPYLRPTRQLSCDAQCADLQWMLR